MIARLLLFALIAALAVIAAERLRTLLTGHRPTTRGGRPLRDMPSASGEIQQATRCPACHAWVVAGTSCRCEE